ncbi:prephenate dehydratase / chorismate mutase [Actinobacillus equuli]|nr:prephenate dehydratase / chorismate mutase [Actinobacillus equuli]
MSLDLSNIRQQITQLDRHLLKLLAERHRLAFDVVRSKEITQNRYVISNEKRAITSTSKPCRSGKLPIRSAICHTNFPTYYRRFRVDSANYLQNKLNEQKEQNVSIAFLGMRGSYSNMASRQFAKNIKVL